MTTLRDVTILVIGLMLSRWPWPNRETTCWGHYFNGFVGALLFLTGCDLAS